MDTTTLAPTQRRQRPPAFRIRRPLGPCRGARVRCDECGRLSRLVVLVEYARGLQFYERVACLSCLDRLRVEEAEGRGLDAAWSVGVIGIHAGSREWPRVGAA